MAKEVTHGAAGERPGLGEKKEAERATIGNPNTECPAELSDGRGVDAASNADVRGDGRVERDGRERPATRSRKETQLLREKGWCGFITGEPPLERACILEIGHNDDIHEAGSSERFERAKTTWTEVTGKDVSHLQRPNDARGLEPGQMPVFRLLRARLGSVTDWLLRDIANEIALLFQEPQRPEPARNWEREVGEIAHVLGIEHATDGRAAEPGPLRDMLAEIVGLKRDSALWRDHVVTAPRSLTDRELLRDPKTYERSDEDADAFIARLGSGEPDEPARRCQACDQVRTDVGELPDTLPLCAQCAKAHRMGYRCGEEAATLWGAEPAATPLRDRMRASVLRMLASIRREPVTPAEAGLADVCELLLDLAAPELRPAAAPEEHPEARAIRIMAEQLEQLGAEPCNGCGYSLNEIRDYVHELAALRKVAEAARAVLEAVDACDREAERHPSSRSSAPMVRYIGAMKRLQAALDAKKET